MKARTRLRTKVSQEMMQLRRVAGGVAMSKRALASGAAASTKARGLSPTHRSAYRADFKSEGPREIELKLQFPLGSRAILEGSGAFSGVKARQFHQVTTYFDTSESLLDAAGYTLRVRRSGNSRIQNVKSVGSRCGVAENRSEWEWLIRQDVPDVKRLAEIQELSDIARAIKSRLKPVFVTDIRRTTRLLHLDTDTIVEAAIDEGSIEANGRQEPVAELELELKGGPIGPLYRLAAELQVTTPLWISPESKSARGWRLRTGQTGEAQHSQPPELGRHIRAADGLHEIICGTLGHLMANIGPTLCGSTEGLHQMRIALRESRAALKLFDRYLDAVTAERFSAGLQRFGRTFGLARDWDVFCLETLPAAMEKLPRQRLRDLVPVAESKRQIARAAVMNALRSQEFTALVLGLASWAEVGRAQPSIFGDRMGKRLRPLAPSLLDLVACRAKKRGRHAGRHSVEEWHRLRKSLKKLCSDVVCFSGLYPRRTVNAYKGRCEDLLAVLGVANDAVVMQRLAPQLATDNRPDLAKPAGALVQWGERQVHKDLKALKGAQKRFSATLPFWS